MFSIGAPCPPHSWRGRKQALLHAASNGNTATMLMLLDAGADIDAVDLSAPEWVLGPGPPKRWLPFPFAPDSARSHPKVPPAASDSVRRATLHTE